MYVNSERRILKGEGKNIFKYYIIVFYLFISQIICINISLLNVRFDCYGVWLKIFIFLTNF